MRKIVLLLMGLLLLVACEPAIPDESFVSLEAPGSEMPITTWEQARGYAVETFGSEEIWDCDCAECSQFLLNLTGDIPIDEFGYRGWRVMSDGRIAGYIVLFECSHVTGSSGRVVASFWFDPNNAWIQKLYCRDESVDCPTYNNGSVIDIDRRSHENPDYEIYLDLEVSDG